MTFRGGCCTRFPRGGRRCSTPFTWASTKCGRPSIRKRRCWSFPTVVTTIAGIPVASADFMRFLLDWQGLTRTPRPEGVASLNSVIEQLEGYEVPAVAWEGDVLPARLQDYDGAWLDSLCLSGRALWARLDRPASATAGPVRATPIALLTRKNWPLWQSLRPLDGQQAPLSANAQAMADYLQQHGSSFFDELMHGTGLLRAQTESTLAE